MNTGKFFVVTSFEIEKSQLEVYEPQPLILYYREESRGDYVLRIMGIYSSEHVRSMIETDFDGKIKVYDHQPFIADETKKDAFVVCIPVNDEDGVMSEKMIKKLIASDAFGDREKINHWVSGPSSFYSFKECDDIPLIIDLLPRFMGLCKGIRWKTHFPITYGLKMIKGQAKHYKPKASGTWSVVSSR